MFPIIIITVRSVISYKTKYSLISLKSLYDVYRLFLVSGCIKGNYFISLMLFLYFHLANLVIVSTLLNLSLIKNLIV